MKMAPIINNWLVNHRASAVQSVTSTPERRDPDDTPRMAILTAAGLFNAGLWVVIIWLISHIIQVVTNGAFEPFHLVSEWTMWTIVLVWPMSIVGLTLTDSMSERPAF